MNPQGEPSAKGISVGRSPSFRIVFLAVGITAGLFLVCARLFGPYRAVLTNRTGAPLRNVSVVILERDATVGATVKSSELLPANSSIRFSGTSSESFKVRFSATSSSGYVIEDSASIYNDIQFSEDHFDVINGEMEVQGFFSRLPASQIPSVVRLEVAPRDTVYNAVISLRDTLNSELIPTLHVSKLLPGDTARLEPPGYRGFATLALTGIVRRGILRDSSDFEFGGSPNPRRATVYGPGIRARRSKPVR